MDPNAVHLEHLVIDSGAIIRGQGFNYFNASKRFWTVQEVLGEIRDSKARHLLASLPFEIEVRSPSDSAIRAVVEFARKTGDLGQLSMVDLKVLALTYDLEVETNGTKYIRTEPKKTLKAPEVSSKAPVAAGALVVKEASPCECCPQDEHGHDLDDAGGWTAVGSTLPLTSAGSEAIIDEDSVSSAGAAELNESDVDIMHSYSSDSESHDGDDLDTVKRSPLDEDELLKDVGALDIKSVETEAIQVPSPVEFNLMEEENAFPSLGGPAPRVVPAAAAPGLWVKAVQKEKPAGVDSTTPVHVVIAPWNVSEVEVVERKPLFDEAQPSESPAWPVTTGSAPSRIMRSTGAAEYSSSQTNQFRADEDDGENWISPVNISSARATGQGMLGGGRTQGVTSAAVVSNAKVACVTTDFSMENVLLQMGMKLLSVEGRLIHRVKQWVLRCAACRTIHYDVDRLFCSKCGVNMLQRIACSTDSKTGELRLHLKKNYKTNTRGMIHSLPKAGSQGRYDGELLLREDQLLTGIWRQKVAKIRHDVKSAFGDDITGDVGLHINKREYGLKVGLGRRNPNADKGRERRGKKKSTKH